MLFDNAIKLDLWNINEDANHGAYEEIIDKVKNDTNLSKKVTVKILLDYFSKKPFGWRDIDILGMVGCLWKNKVIQIFIHDNVVDDKNSTFKNDLVHKTNVDTMVVKIQEKIGKDVLYAVKRIMNTTYSENLPLDEEKLKDGVVSFFDRKKKFLSDLKVKYGVDYAGSKVATDIYNDFQAILKSSDTLTIFNEIIARKTSLEDKAETLEQLEAFYKDGSNQQKTYKDAVDIIEWYTNNSLLEDLSKLNDVVNKMNAIVDMELPFSKMSELASLVFQAAEIKDRILQDKFDKVKKQLERDRDTVSKELGEAMVAQLTEDQKYRIQEKGDAVADQYESWLGSINKNTTNLDAYLNASTNTVKEFKKFIAKVMAETGSTVRSKRITVIDCIPVANKKITSADDVDKVISAIRTKLLAELKENDELNLD